jgi:hypothetical protein
LDATGQKAYLEPFPLLADGMWSNTSQLVLSKGEQTLEAWLVIFRHLRNMGNTKVVSVKEGGAEYFGEVKDLGQQHFTTAMKTLQEWRGA